MKSLRQWILPLLMVLTLCGGVGNATNFSYTGAFAGDDSFQLFTFTTTATTVTMRTWSYAGGTNAATNVIPRGGFDPILTLYDGAGNFVISHDNDEDAGCVHVTTDTSGACADSYISQALAAGTYTLALTEADNQAAGGTLGDGFTKTGQGNFTGGEFGCTNGSFCDATTANRSSAWAVDILGVTASTGPATGAPEPGTIALFGVGLAGVALLRRRARRN